MDIHCADITAIVIRPNGVQQRFTGINAVGIAHQEFDNIEFLSGQLHQFAGGIGVSGIQVQGYCANGQQCGSGLGRRGVTAKQGLYSGLQLQNIEGFGDIIVCTAIKAHQFIHVLGFGGQQDDGHIGKLANFSAGSQTVHFRHHDVQNDQTDIGILGKRHSF